MSLAKTYLQDLRATYPNPLDRVENRVTTAGLLEVAMEMTNSPNSIVNDEIKQKAMESEGRNLDIPVMKKGNVTISNVRSCTITGSQSESDKVRLVWRTMATQIAMVPSQYAKNEISYVADLNKKIREAVEAFLIEMEQDIETALDTNKSQVYSSSIVDTKYTLVGDAIQVLPTQTDFFFGDIDAINFSDDFNAMTTKVVANHSVMPYVNKFINQGAGNNQNLNYQFAGKDFRFSNRIPNGNDVLGTLYFMPDGSLAVLTRIDTDSRLNHKASDGTEWMEETLPGLPFTVGIQYKSKCDDQSELENAGLGHLTATMVELWQISFDFAIVTPYNSDITTKPSPIRKVEFVSA